MRLYSRIHGACWGSLIFLALDGAMHDSVLPTWVYPVLSLVFLGGMLYSGIKLHNQ